MDDKKLFAEKLRQQLEAHQKTRKEICADLGIAYSTLTNWCNSTKFPSMNNIEKLADYFGISKADLIGNQPEGLWQEEFFSLNENNGTLSELSVMAKNDTCFFYVGQSKIAATVNRVQSAFWDKNDGEISENENDESEES